MKKSKTKDIIYHIGTDRVKFKESHVKADLPDEEYLRLVFSDPEYEELMKQLTVGGRVRLGKVIGDNIRTLESTTSIKKIMIPELIGVRKKILQHAIRRWESMRVAKAVQTQEERQKLVARTYDTTSIENIISNVGYLETYNVNKFVYDRFNNLGVGYVPFIFKFVKKHRKMRANSKQFSRFFDIIAYVDTDYLAYINQKKVDFTTFLFEKGELRLSSAMHRSNLELLTSGRWDSMDLKMVGVLTEAERKRLKQFWLEFKEKTAQDPDRYIFTKFVPKREVKTKKGVSALNNPSTMTILHISDYMVKYHTKEEDDIDPNDKDGRQLRVKSSEFIQKNLEKKKALGNDDDVFKWIDNEGLIFNKAQLNKIPKTMLRNSPAVIQQVFLDAVDYLVNNLVDNYDKLATTHIDQRRTTAASNLAKRAAKLGLGVADLSADLFAIPKSARAEWQTTKEIKFPNIDSILFWWIRSGQYKMTSATLKKRWERVKLYHIDRKMRFLNHLIFMIASGVYIKKIADARSSGQPFTASMRTHGVRRSVKVARRTREVGWNKAQVARYVKYAEWRDNLRATKVNARNVNRFSDIIDSRRKRLGKRKLK